MGSDAYKESFYDSLDETSLPSARAVVPIVLELVEAGSLVDVGCGNGSWLSVFREHGVSEVLGVDGDWVSTDQLHIPPESFERQRLAESLSIDRHFDLAMTLEVAEHLPPQRAAGFVADLCGLAPVVFFSAAVPGQGGVHHVNEQWPGYWVELFAKHDYVAIDAIRPRIWNQPEIAWWYRQNALLFASPTGLERHPKLREAARAVDAEVAPLVHPELYEAALQRSRPRLKRWLKMAPAALRRTLGT